MGHTSGIRQDGSSSPYDEEIHGICHDNEALTTSSICREINELVIPPETEEGLLDMYPRPSTKFPTYLYSNLVPKMVDNLPPNIDCHKIYMVKYNGKKLGNKNIR